MSISKKYNSKLSSNDLILIDSCLPKILVYAMMTSNCYNISDLSEILTQLNKSNPLNYNQSLGHKFYEYKIKKFLSESVLNVIPNILWSDSYINAEEYIVAEENGVIKYHIINRKVFDDKLLANAIIEKNPEKLMVIQLFYESDRLQFNIRLQLEI